MSSTISSTSTQSSLASALLALNQQSSSETNSSNLAAAWDTDSSAQDLTDSLQLSGSSLSALETSADTIAAQNQNSVIATSEAALAANLAAIAALFSNPSSSSSAQSAPDASQVLKLIA